MGMVSTLGAHQISPGVWTGPDDPSPVHQVLANYFPDQGRYQAQGFYQSSGPYGSPMGMVSHFGNHQGPPGVWNGSAGTSSYHPPSNSLGVGNFPSPGFGQGGSPISNSGQGRGYWFCNSPSSGSGCGGSPTPNSGRGRGRWSGSNMRSGLGQGGKKGLGCHDYISAELRPYLYYDKSMVEDPWMLMTPVILRRGNIIVKSLNTHGSSFTSSVGIKKPRVSEASNESSSQGSLAEYLAAAVNEASNDKPSL